MSIIAGGKRNDLLWTLAQQIVGRSWEKELAEIGATTVFMPQAYWDEQYARVYLSLVRRLNRWLRTCGTSLSKVTIEKVPKPEGGFTILFRDKGIKMSGSRPAR